MLLEDVYREFLFDLEIKNYSVRTIKGYRNNNRTFLNFLCNEFAVTEIEEVSTSHIKAYLMNLKKKGLSESYINGIQKNIRSFFKFIVEEGYIAEKRNPVLGLKWLKQPKVLIQTFDDDEVKRMISVFKGDYYLSLRNKLILMFIVDLGIRNLELCTLATLDVRDSVIKIHGKGNKERNLYISPFLKKYIIKYERVKEAYFIDKMMTDSNFFLSQNGRILTVTAIEVIVKQAGEEARKLINAYSSGENNVVELSVNHCDVCGSNSVKNTDLEVFLISKESKVISITVQEDYCMECGAVYFAYEGDQQALGHLKYLYLTR